MTLLKWRADDLARLQQQIVGFDRMFDVFENIVTEKSTFPHHNIAKEDENLYTVELAVAGFRMEELNITLDKDQLIIEGNPTFKEFQDEEHVEWKQSESPVHFLHKGIANRTFIPAIKRKGSLGARYYKWTFNNGVDMLRGRKFDWKAIPSFAFWIVVMTAVGLFITKEQHDKL